MIWSCDQHVIMHSLLEQQEQQESEQLLQQNREWYVECRGVLQGDHNYPYE